MTMFCYSTVVASKSPPLVIQGCPTKLEIETQVTPDLEINLLLNLTENDLEGNSTFSRTTVNTSYIITTRSTTFLTNTSGIVNATLDKDKKFLSLIISSSNLGRDAESVLINISIKFSNSNDTVSDDCFFFINVTITATNDSVTGGTTVSTVIEATGTQTTNESTDTQTTNEATDNQTAIITAFTATKSSEIETDVIILISVVLGMSLIGILLGSILVTVFIL